MTGDQVAKLSRIKHTTPRAVEIRKLLALYDVEGSYADDLLALAREAAGKGWWETFSSTLPPEYAALIGMEAEAQSALSWEPLIVPGLLQTGDYAREVTNGYLERIDPVPPSETLRRVEARLARQQVLARLGEGERVRTAVEQLHPGEPLERFASNLAAALNSWSPFDVNFYAVDFMYRNSRSLFAFL